MDCEGAVGGGRCFAPSSQSAALQRPGNAAGAPPLARPIQTTQTAPRNQETVAGERVKRHYYNPARCLTVGGDVGGERGAGLEVAGRQARQRAQLAGRHLRHLAPDEEAVVQRVELFALGQLVGGAHQA